MVAACACGAFSVSIRRRASVVLTRLLPLGSALVATATVAACTLRSSADPAVPGLGAPSPVPAALLVDPAGPPPTASDSLIVVSWNVHVGGGDIPAMVADLRSGALTGIPVRRGVVILLQETHRTGDEALRNPAGKDGQTLHNDPPDGARLDVVAVAERLGLNLAYAPAEPNGRVDPDSPREDRGVAILSDLPLTGARVIELPNERQRRVALVGTVRGTRRDGSGWSLRVATAHLENRAPWRRFLDSFGAVRVRQARSLLRQLGDDPVVLGADLNNWGPDFLEPALDVVRRSFPDTPETDGATFTVAGVGWRLDHLFFRLPTGTTAEVRVAPDQYGSDHAPVLGVVELGRRALPAG